VVQQIDPELYPWLSAGMIAWGLLDCFFGYKIFKLSIIVGGAVMGAVVGNIFGTALVPGMTGMGLGLVAGALLGGGLAYLLYLTMVFLAGMMFGLTLGLLIFSNYDPRIAIIAGGGLSLVGGYLAVKLQPIVLILATALVGAFRALLAFLFFTHPIDWVYYVSQQPQQIPILIENHNWLLPATLALTALGAMVQFSQQRGSRSKKDRVGETDNCK
jgi:hypothetical protein